MHRGKYHRSNMSTPNDLEHASPTTSLLWRALCVLAHVFLRAQVAISILQFVPGSFDDHQGPDLLANPTEDRSSTHTKEAERTPSDRE
jgi:hypothetical protein